MAVTSATTLASSPFNEAEWEKAGPLLTDLTVHRHKDLGVLRIGFDRPEVRNAFRPETVDSLLQALEFAQSAQNVGVVSVSYTHLTLPTTPYV